MRPVLNFNRERCLGCLSCELACSVVHSTSELLEAALEEEIPARRRVAMAPLKARDNAGRRAGAEALDSGTLAARLKPCPDTEHARCERDGGTPQPLNVEARRCEQCGEPLCVFACKSGALSRDPLTGRIALDDARCVGCFMCLTVCPFGVRPDAERDRVVRCDVCEDRAIPACVAACPTGALAAGVAVEDRPRNAFGGRVVVVGSSAAGIAACEAAREFAPDCSITLVTADASPQYSRPLLSYVLAGTIGPSRIDWRAEGYLAKLGVRVLARRKAAQLRPDTRSLLLDDGNELPYDALIVATGARAAKLEIPGADIAGVYGLRNLEDMEAIARLAGPERRAVVLGGGNVGLQVCEAFLARGMTVSVVVASPHLLSQMVDAEAGRRLAELFGSHRLNVQTGREAVEIAGQGRVEEVRLDSGERIPADVVVVAKGIAPNIEWVRSSGVRVGRGIVVDRRGSTNLPGVFAAGDCAEAPDPLSGRTSLSGIWPVAYEMGRAAGSSAVGIERTAAGALRMNASRFFGVSIVSIGEVRCERLEGASQKVLANRAGVYRKLVFHGDRLAGALLYGDISDAGSFYRRYREDWGVS